MYYGVSLNVGNFGLDIYLTQFIFGIAEVPARLGCFPLIERFGRRICQSVALFIGGAACLIIPAIPAGISPNVFSICWPLASLAIFEEFDSFNTVLLTNHYICN